MRTQGCRPLSLPLPRLPNTLDMESETWGISHGNLLLGIHTVGRRPGGARHHPLRGQPLWATVSSAHPVSALLLLAAIPPRYFLGSFQSPPSLRPFGLFKAGG